MSSPSEELANSSSPVVAGSEASLLDLLIVFAKHKTMMVGVSLGAGLLAATVSLILPNVYTGITRLMPPQQAQSTAAMLLGQLGGLASLAAGTVGVKNPNDLYVGMLRSRTVTDRIIERFDLRTLYDEETLVDTRKELLSNTSISSGKDGLIVIEFDDEDPKRAAAVANAFAEELDKLSQSLAVTEAAQRRLFFERQLLQAKKDLSDAEVALKVTQEKTGLIKLDDQGKAIIEAVAAIRGQIAAKEVELRAMQTFATDSNADLVRVRQQLAGLRAELAKLERAQISGSGDILLPTGKVPEAGLEYLRKYRDVKYQEAIFELLAKQFEGAKIDEAKDAAIVQVLDPAVVPDKKSGPKRALIVAASLVLGFFVSVILALARESMRHAQSDPSQSARLDLLRRYLGFHRGKLS